MEATPAKKSPLKGFLIVTSAVIAGLLIVKGGEMLVKKFVTKKA